MPASAAGPSVTVLAIRPVDMAVIVVAVIVRSVVLSRVLVGMSVVMVMVVGVIVGVIVGMPVIVAALAMVMRFAFGLEGARDRRRGATLATDQFGIRSRIGNVEEIGADLRRDVAAAQLPGQAQEPGGILRAHFEKGFGRGTHGDEAPVLESQRIAVLQRSGLLKGDGEAHPGRTGEDRGRTLPAGMIQCHGVGYGIGADGGFANDGGGAQHEILGKVGSSRTAARGCSGCLSRISRGFSAGTESVAGTLLVTCAFHERNG